MERPIKRYWLHCQINLGKKVKSYIVELDTIYQELISMYDWSRGAFVSYKWGIPVSQYAMDHDYN